MDFIRQRYKSRMRPYRDRPDVEVAGRWHWCPPGAKDIPYMHAFGSFTLDSTDDVLDPPVGERPQKTGRVRAQIENPRYTGQRFCGSETTWEDGALYAQRATPATDEDGVPICCQALEQQPGGQVSDGEATAVVIPNPATWCGWWRAEDADTSVDPRRVESVPNYAGTGPDLLGVGGNRPGYDAGAMLFTGYFYAPANYGRTLLALSEAKQVTAFTCYAVMSQAPGTRHLWSGVGVNGNLGGPNYGTPVFGPTVWGAGVVGHNAFGPFTHEGGPHLYRARADGTTLILSKDGCEEVSAPLPINLAAPPTLSNLLAMGATETPVGVLYFYSAAALFEMVLVPYAVSDDEDAVWTDLLLGKYGIPRGPC